MKANIKKRNEKTETEKIFSAQKVTTRTKND